MTREQEDHLQTIKWYFTTNCDTKYRKGQAEHGGNLFDLTPIQLLDSAIEEAIDQVVYLVTLRQKLSINHVHNTNDLSKESLPNNQNLQSST
jgi:hypothetical protein